MSDPPFNLIPRPPHNSKPWDRKCTGRYGFDKCFKLIYIPLASLEKYHTMCSWFLGHRGENAETMKHTMNYIVDQVKAGRIAFGSDDEVRLVSFYRIQYLISLAPHLLLAGFRHHNHF